ncbi:MAG: PTS sugar transporter subunit IIB [Deltaproteobacteria bacterium]|nr:PTS sugar transporter subunit IIB [Deltaproteobacteria bacterium]
MAIVLARIDSRLIHGQVLEGWIPHTGTSMVIVADDKVVANPIQKKVMEMAVPEEIKLKIETVDEAVADLESGLFDSERIMLIFSSPHDAGSACKKGLKCSSVNLGNVNYMAGRRQVTASIALDDDDVRDIRELIDAGVAIDVRSVPGEKPKKIEELVKRYFDICGRDH